MRRTSNSLQLRPRHHQVLRLLWAGESLSRRDLQRRMEVHPNLIGDDISHLLKQRLVIEGDATINGRGRPGIPLRIDPTSRHIIGLAISPDGVQISKVNLLGKPIDSPTAVKVSDTKTMIRRAAKLLKETINADTLAIGASTTGLVDPLEKTLLLSSAIPKSPATSLAPLYEAAGETPLILQNDMHALAARWLLDDGAANQQDVLLVLLEDGRIGSAMLLHGSPNQGCAIGANELGHMRFPVATAKCYCGHEGCLERIFSSEQLAKHASRSRRSLAEEMSQPVGHSPASGEILNLLCGGIANAANFVRPHRLVVTGSLIRHDAFFGRLAAGVQPLLLSGLSDRMKIERWTLPTLTWSEISAWVALVELLNVGA